MLFYCEKYDILRQSLYSKITKPENFIDLSNSEKLKIVLNESMNVKFTAQYLIDMLDLRRLINTQY